MLLCAGAAATLSAIAGMPFRLLVVPMSVAAVAPLSFSLWLWKRQLKKLESQLPDALFQIATALKSGVSFETALQHGAEGSRAPLSNELNKLCESLRLGVPAEEALERFARRWGTPHLRFMVSALKLHARVGGNIGAILMDISFLIRERSELVRQVSAFAAEARLSGAVLITLPLVAFTAMFLLSRDYIQTLLDDPLGQRLLAITVVLQIIGTITIRKMVKAIA